MKDSSYEDKIVAFIDILGFTSLVMSINTHPEVHDRLLYALKLIKSRKAPELSDFTDYQIEVSVFSDSIALSTNCDNLWGIIWSCGSLQAEILKVGVLTRGGISKGKTFHEDDILYGEGMINAYRIESKAAIYPRIVLDPKLIPGLNEGLRYYSLRQDSDSLWFINPFSFNAIIDDTDELTADGYDPHELYLKELGDHIDKGKAEAKTVDQVSKWTWLKRIYMDERRDYLKTHETKMDKLFKALSPEKGNRTIS